jgi:hypothetical protein
MLRQVRPEAKLTAVECDKDYVERYRLADIYDVVRVEDAVHLMDEVDQVFDVAVLGDSIEHMRKSVGVDLLHFLVYRSRLIVLKFPLQMPQASLEGHKSEAHVSVWSEHDFRGFDHVYTERNFLCLVLVRGYLNNSLDWIPDSVMTRLGHGTLREFYARDPMRVSLSDAASRRQAACFSELRNVIAAGSTYLLVDEMQTNLSEDTERTPLPFLERDGQYWGRPQDDEQAIADLERLRHTRGVSHIVFAWPAHWWLDYYTGFAEYLNNRYGRVIQNERLVVFDLCPRV